MFILFQLTELTKHYIYSYGFTVKDTTQEQPNEED